MRLWSWWLLIAAILPVACSGADPRTAKGNGSPLRNTIRWTTASEVDNFGFDVLRAESEEGPFRAVNEKLIPGAGTVDVPTDYTFADESIEPGVAYHYYVESISIRGKRERVTPILRSAPKWPERENESLDGK